MIFLTFAPKSFVFFNLLFFSRFFKLFKSYEQSNTFNFEHIVCGEKTKRGFALCVTLAVTTALGLSSLSSSSSAVAVAVTVTATTAVAAS
jgi:hypothetical protein